jgi:hypothetical protein
MPPFDLLSLCAYESPSFFDATDEVDWELQDDADTDERVQKEWPAECA